MDAVDKLYEYLQSASSQAEIKDIVDQTNQDLADDVQIRKCREYPIGDSYYIDYLENNFDEDKGRKQFYDDVAKYIKDWMLTEEELELLDDERISDADLCIDYAEVCFDAETIIDLAIEDALRS